MEWEMSGKGYHIDHAGWLVVVQDRNILCFWDDLKKKKSHQENIFSIAYMR